MEVNSGSCRLGLWFVHVWWSGNTVFQVRFSRHPLAGYAPGQFIRYCSGKREDFSDLHSEAVLYPTVYGRIYREVSGIPYGKTATYGEIAQTVNTSPRVVGQAMKRNPTPLVIPCHRVVSRTGIGGFSPSPEIKQALLQMERKMVDRES